MAWTTPTIVEVCAGFEVTAYVSADGIEDRHERLIP
jgi:coenzyme PQQ precursor peptide PqqA